MPRLRLLLVTGSTRAASTNTAALRAAVELLAPAVDAALHDALAELPAFDPDRDHDPLPEPVARACATRSRRQAASCSARRSTRARCRDR